MSGRLRLGTSPATNPSLSCTVAPSRLNGTHCDARPRPQKQRSEGGNFLEEEGRVQERPLPRSNPRQSRALCVCNSNHSLLCCASDSGSPSPLTGRCQDVSDRVGTGRVAEGFPLERILSAREFITICGPEKFVCNVQCAKGCDCSNI
jgi:hypothetical protein